MKRLFRESVLTGAFCLGAAGCATMPRLHSPQELSGVVRNCGLAEGEVVQEAEEPRILFLYRIAPSPTQRACVASWARKHRLHLALIDSVNWTTP